MQIRYNSNKKWLEIATHCVAWLTIFFLPHLMRYNSAPYPPAPGDTNSFFDLHFFYVNLLTKLFWVAVFYLNAFLLARLFVYRKQYIRYGLIIVSLFYITSLAQERLIHLLDKDRPRKMMFISAAGGTTTGAKPVPGGPPPGNRFRGQGAMLTFNLAPYFLTIAASILYRLLRDKSRTDTLALQRQEENLKTELSFLRSQISPHFIFNILNNITALARMKSDELEPTVLKLSSLMRYMLYEANEDKVMLRTEVEYLNSYIELQGQRFGRKVLVQARLEAGKNDHIRIEPMLLIPFVENAFKHGVSLIDRPQIVISLQLQQSLLTFRVSNKYSRNDGEIKDGASGIGFANVQRRLNLLYAGNHTLNLQQETDGDNNHWFHIVLELKLPS